MEVWITPSYGVSIVWCSAIATMLPVASHIIASVFGILSVLAVKLVSRRGKIERSPARVQSILQGIKRGPIAHRSVRSCTFILHNLATTEEAFQRTPSLDFVFLKSSGHHLLK